MTRPRRLVLMRHAKAEPYASTDHDRPLTATGRRQAAEAGIFLAAVGAVPTHALVSGALRTQETWAEVRAASGSSAEAEVSEAAYGAEPETILTLLRELPAEAETVLFLGHNPAVWQLAGLLVDDAVDPRLWGALMHGFPPSATAVFELEDAWSALAPGSARLTGLHPQPR